MKKVCILSLDGGGIRGIISCIIVRYIEEQLKRLDNDEAKLGDYFDMVAGSSTGGIIASIILFPGEDKKAKYSIQTGLELYSDRGEDIFHISYWQRLLNPFGLFSEKISESHLENNLEKFFGNLQLRDFIKPSLITSYDMENRRAKLFNSVDAKDQVENFYVRDICRATSAAPTYFPPARIRSLYGQYFSLIDGGIYANNPALCAYAEARKMPFGKLMNSKEKMDFPAAKDMMIVSVGTGAEARPYLYSKFRRAGKLAWVSPIIDMLMSANAETVDYQMSQMFGTLSPRNQQNYYRINPSIKNASPQMDNVEKWNMEELIQAGLGYVDDQKEMLNEITRKLVANKI